MDIFPVFDEFLPYFPFQFSNSTFCTISCKIVKNFHLQLFSRNFVLDMEKLKDAMKIFTGVRKKKQGRNWHFLSEEGEKIGAFGQNIYPWNTKWLLLEKSILLGWTYYQIVRNFKGHLKVVVFVLIQYVSCIKSW